MSIFGTERTAIRQQLVTKVPAARVYITSNPKSFFETSGWESPALVVDFEQMHMLDEQNVLIGQGQQKRTLFFSVYVAVRGADITLGTPAGTDPSKDLGTIETNEAMASGVYDLVDSVETAMMFFQIPGASPVAVVLSRGWEKWATAPYTLIYVVRFRIAGGVIGSQIP